MKVLVVLGISSLIAVSAGSIPPGGSEQRCCNSSKQDIFCITFRDLVAKEAQKIDMAELDEKTLGELKFKSRIDAFSNAAQECIPRNQLYRKLQLMVDDLNAIIDTYPTPMNILTKIREAEELMDEHFDNLQAAKNEAGSKLSPEVSGKVDEFVRQSMQRAAKVFEYNHEKAKDNTWLFDDNQIYDLIDKIVDRLNECLENKPTDFDANFNCRQKVRILRLALQDKIKDVHIMGKIRISPDLSIDRMISNFTTEEKALEDLITNDSLHSAFMRDSNGFFR